MSTRRLDVRYGGGCCSTLKGVSNMTEHSIIIEIQSDQENAAEQMVNNLHKEASEAKRYGVDIQVRRVQIAKQDIEGFDE